MAMHRLRERDAQEVEPESRPLAAAGARPRAVSGPDRRVAALRMEGAKRGEVEERIAEERIFPVDHRAHPRRIDEEVVASGIAVQQGRGRLAAARLEARL